MGKTNYGFYLIGGGLAFVVGALSWIFVFAPEDDYKPVRAPDRDSESSSSSSSSGAGGNSGYNPSSERVSSSDETEQEPYALKGGSRRKLY